MLGGFGNGLVTGQTGITHHQNLGVPMPTPLAGLLSPVLLGALLHRQLALGRVQLRKYREMGLGQTNLALLLRSWGAGSSGLGSEARCFGKSRAGHGLSLQLGITVGSSIVQGATSGPGSHFLSSCVHQQDGIFLLSPQLFHSTKINTLSGKCLS